MNVEKLSEKLNEWQQECKDIPSVWNAYSKIINYIESNPVELQDRNYGSKELIGNVQERFNELIDKGWDWRSFYNGWIEGRSILKPNNHGTKQTKW